MIASLVLGTGIGGGVMIDKKIISGVNSGAGEFGCLLNAYSEDEKDTTNYSIMGSTVNSTKLINKRLKTNHTTEEMFKLYDEGNKDIIIEIDN
jgi:predicted NBD/HSP70 family sugar kinase